MYLDHQNLGRERGTVLQQGPLSTGAIGRFLQDVERLRRRMRVRFGGSWIADSEQVLLLFEPDRYPFVAEVVRERACGSGPATAASG